MYQGNETTFNIKKTPVRKKKKIVCHGAPTLKQTTAHGCYTWTNTNNENKQYTHAWLRCTDQYVQHLSEEVNLWCKTNALDDVPLQSCLSNNATNIITATFKTWMAKQRIPPPSPNIWNLIRIFGVILLTNKSTTQQMDTGKNLLGSGK